MQNLPTNTARKSRDVYGASILHFQPTEKRPIRAATRDEQFLNMLNAFRLTGGLARGHEVASLLYKKSGLNVGTLARWMVEGEVVYFDWQHDTWFPMFQFSGPDLSIRLGIRQVLKEFGGVLSPWETAQWFSCPSDALSCRAPADEMALHPDRVLEAARSSRFAVDA